MKKIFGKIFLACTVLLGISLNQFVFGQDLDKDMKQFCYGFISQPSLECHMVAKAYRPDQSLFYDKTVKLIIHHNQYYYDMGDMLYIANKEHILWVDKKDKRIIAGTTNVNEVEKFKKQLVKQLDTMTFQSMGQVVFEGNNSGIKSYKIVNLLHGYIKQANISFDANTHFIKKMEYIFKEDVTAGILSSFTEFTLIDTKPNISESLFDQSAYIQVKKGVISLAPAYKNYQLVTIDNSLLNKIK